MGEGEGEDGGMEGKRRGVNLLRRGGDYLYCRYSHYIATAFCLDLYSQASVVIFPVGTSVMQCILWLSLQK